MSEQLQQIAQEWTEEKLLEEFYHKREEYTPGALKILEAEIARRPIPQETVTAFLGRPSQPQQFSRDEFVCFDHLFSHADVLLIIAILNDKKIPHFTDTPNSSNIIPVESELLRQYSLHVHREFVQQAHALIDEHFDKANGVYAAKQLNPKERLRSVNFHEMRISEAQYKERVDAELSPEEREGIARYAARALAEADTIERQQERPIFFYDNIEDLLGRLQKSARPKLTVADLLTVLEILQIFSAEPDFPAQLDETISGLLDFVKDLAGA
jgi:hypothetical protein